MPKIVITAKPADKTPVGWDVQLFSWSADRVDIIDHRLTWSSKGDGTFILESGDLRPGRYGLHGAAIGAGRKVEFSVAGQARVVQPRNTRWPMVVDVATGSQDSHTWYFDWLVGHAA